MFEFGAVAAVIGGNGVSDLRTSCPNIKRRRGPSTDSTPTRQSETAESGRTWFSQPPDGFCDEESFLVVGLVIVMRSISSPLSLTCLNLSERPSTSTTVNE